MWITLECKGGINVSPRFVFTEALHSHYLTIDIHTGWVYLAAAQTCFLLTGARSLVSLTITIFGVYHTVRSCGLLREEAMIFVVIRAI